MLPCSLPTTRRTFVPRGEEDPKGGDYFPLGRLEWSEERGEGKRGGLFVGGRDHLVAEEEEEEEDPVAVLLRGDADESELVGDLRGFLLEERHLLHEFLHIHSEGGRERRDGGIG
jgi:hypothetical protein